MVDSFSVVPADGLIHLRAASDVSQEDCSEMMRMMRTRAKIALG